MANSPSLPPPLDADTSMRALGKLGARLEHLDLNTLMLYLIDLVDGSALPWLADQFALFGNGWELAESDEVRRILIKSAIELHRYKGTPWSLRQVIRNLGFGEIQLREGEAQLAPELVQQYPEETRWALYQIVLSQAVTNDQAASIRRTLAAFAPARCHLASLDYTAVPIRYNNRARYDGQYNHGSS